MTWAVPKEFWRVYKALRWPVHVLVSLGVLGDLAVDECLSLRWANVDMDARTINVREVVKRHRVRGTLDDVPAPDPRVVAMSDELHRVLKAWWDRSGWQGVVPERVVHPRRSDASYLHLYTARKYLRQALADVELSPRSFAQATGNFCERLLGSLEAEADDPYALAIQTEGRV